MRKQNLITLMAIELLMVFPTLILPSEKHNKRSLGILCVTGWWPISNNFGPNSDVMTSPFGPRRLTADLYDFHEGTDIQANHQQVWAAFNGTIFQVNAQQSNANDSWVILRHVDPCDNTTFYTCYHHLQYNQQLQNLTTRIGMAVTAGQFQTGLNPFAESGNSGTTDVHLHFAGTVGGTNAQSNAINIMREDSLPYNNNHPNNENPPTFGAPTIQNIVLTTNPRRLSFRVSTHHEELDLERIVVGQGIDVVETNFFTRRNCDVNYGIPAGNEDGTIATTTSFGQNITITITTFNFNPGANQIMDFRYDLPIGWSGNSFSIFVEDTQRLRDDATVVTSVRDNNESIHLPVAYQLLQNYPNPFNPSTTIRFALPKKSIVSLAIYDERGSVVRELVTQKHYDVGEGELVWDGTNTAGLPAASGAYFYRLTAEGVDNKKLFLQTKKLLLVR